jgi:hypothetical protein
MTFEIAPMRFLHKGEVSSLIAKSEQGKDLSQMMSAVFLAIKYSLKNVKGIELDDQTEYQLTFQGDCLTDDCVEDICNLPQSMKIFQGIVALISGQDKIIDPNTGEQLEGVSFLEVPKVIQKPPEL